MNNQQRVIKRSIIVLVYLAVLALIFWGIYLLLAPEETCFDQKKNQNEEDVDCGGECAPCEKIQYENLKVLESGITESGSEGQIDVYVQVENPNSSLGAKEVKYELVVLGDDDAELAKRTGSSFFLPHEKKTIIENNLNVEKSQVRKIRWKVLETEWANFNSSFENPNFRIINKNINIGFPFSSASGLLINESPYDFSLIQIKVILRDNQNKIRFINSTEMRTVKSNEEREFKVIWPKELPDDIMKVEVEAEVNVFDPQSFFKDYYELQKFQELTLTE